MVSPRGFYRIRKHNNPGRTDQDPGITLPSLTGGQNSDNSMSVLHNRTHLFRKVPLKGSWRGKCYRESRLPNQRLQRDWKMFSIENFLKSSGKRPQKEFIQLEDWKPLKTHLPFILFKIKGNYRDRLKGVQILLSNSQAGPGGKVKQEQEEIARNHVQAF